MRVVFIAILFLFAIKSNGQDFQKIADEYCNCYSTLEDSIHVEYVNHIVAASREPQFTVAYFKAISEKGKDFASTGMRSWTRLKQAMINENSEMGKCAAALNSKYIQYLNDDTKKKAFYLSVLEELERTGSCGFYAAVLRSIYRQSE